MIILEIDGKRYDKVPIINYEVSPEILDGEGSGRSKAQGWPMIRDPQGAMIHLNVEFGLTDSENPDFIELWNKILSLGREESVFVRLILPVGELLAQDMFAVPSPIKVRRINRNDIIYNETWKVNFIAVKGVPL